MCYCPYSACFASVNVLFQPLMHMMLFSMCLTVLCEHVSYQLLPVMHVLMSFVCLLPCATVLSQRVLPAWTCVPFMTVLPQTVFDVLLSFFRLVFMWHFSSPVLCSWPSKTGKHGRKAGTLSLMPVVNTPLAVSCVLYPLWWGDSVVVTCVVS